MILQDLFRYVLELPKRDVDLIYAFVAGVRASQLAAERDEKDIKKGGNKHE